ncbi:MAG: Rid family detoxifying hydrolase [Bacteroidia bacterium]|nr:Rid family detoxifying hydrolase [Bacteroidia bacterium]
MKKIFTSNAPAPAGHYSQAIVSNGLVFISGQLAITSDGQKMVDSPVEDQTRLIFNNIEAILGASGSALEQIVQVTIYISDGDNWGKVNETYIKIFGDHKPARAVVPTRDLHYGLAIEVQVIAEVG